MNYIGQLQKNLSMINENVQNPLSFPHSKKTLKQMRKIIKRSVKQKSFMMSADPIIDDINLGIDKCLACFKQKDPVMVREDVAVYCYFLEERLEKLTYCQLKDKIDNR